MTAQYSLCLDFDSHWASQYAKYPYLSPAKLTAQSETLKFAPMSLIAFPAIVNDFVNDLKNRGEGISPLTVNGYRADVLRFVAWFHTTTGESFAANHVTPVDVRDYKANLQTICKFKPASVNRRIAALRAFFGWAIQKGEISESPVRVHNLEESPTAPRSIDERTYFRLLRAVQRFGNRRDIAIIQLLRHTGIRVQELCNLFLEDIQVSERKGRIVVRYGKGGRYREIPLNLDVRQSLNAYLAARPQIVDQHLFIGQRKNGLTDTAIQEVVAKFGRLAGIDGVSPHVLRHTFGRNLIDRGVDLVTVQNLMGHKRIDTTARYTQPSQQNLELAVARLEIEEEPI